MITLTFHPQKQQPPRTGPQGFDGVMLQSGRQQIGAADWQKLQAHPGFATLLALEAAIIHELEPERETSQTQGDAPSEANPQAEPPPASLAGYTTDKALPIIASTANLEVLRKWAAAETRIGVGDALKDRIAELQEST